MPYLPYLNKFATGINPSVRSAIDLQNLTGTQKIMLAGRRIFGTNFGGTEDSGNKTLYKQQCYRKRLTWWECPLQGMQYYHPGIKFYRIDDFERQLREKLRLRILMRGVKLGKRKGGDKITIMNIFEKKKGEKKPEEAPPAE